jgi:hypothetical protein
MGLKYVGGAFFVGIPARDIDDDELEQLSGIWEQMQQGNPHLRQKTLKQFLVQSGYYKAETGLRANKALLPAHENKDEVTHGRN